MNDDELLTNLRAGARRAHGARTGTALDVPLGDAFEERVTAQILAAQRATARGYARAAEAKPPAKVIPLGASRVTRALAGLAAAAALVLAVTHLRKPAEVADLPGYALVVTGGQDTTRSAAPQGTDDVRAPADAPLTVLLRPPVEVSGPVVATAFALRGGHASPASAAIRISESGSIEVQGAARDLAGAAPGDATLVVVIARKETAVDARAIAEGAPVPHGATVARARIHVLP